ALAEAGANVLIHGTRTEGLEEVCAQVSATRAKSASRACDLTSPDACASLIEAALAEFGSLDILVNNAGVIPRGPAEDASAANWDAILDINLTAVFRMSQLAGRHMLARGSGKIINVASLLSF